MTQPTIINLDADGKKMKPSRKGPSLEAIIALAFLFPFLILLWRWALS